MLANDSYVLCLTTVAQEEDARKIAQQLLKQKLVACVNISARSSSLYSWQGELVEEHEYLVQLKTHSQKVAELETKLHELHPYQVPEFIVLKIEHGSHGYLDWIADCLS